MSKNWCAASDLFTCWSFSSSVKGFFDVSPSLLPSPIVSKAKHARITLLFDRPSCDHMMPVCNLYDDIYQSDGTARAFLTFTGVFHCWLFSRWLAVCFQTENMSCRLHVGLVNVWVVLVFHQPGARPSVFNMRTEARVHQSRLRSHNEVTHQSMACSIPWFPVKATAFSLQKWINKLGVGMRNSGWYFTFISLKTDQIIALTPCSCQSPSPAGFLVSFALPCWPETGYTNQQLPFWHADRQLVYAVGKVSLPLRLITINDQKCQEITLEKTPS